ncbi:hypothetical protein SRHO_G00120210 [Serrasalmus rhombeus]
MRARAQQKRWPAGGRVLALLCALLLTVAAVRGCPAKCSCSGSHVECQQQGFRSVPRGIPRNAERLDLDRNNITRITKVDFSGLKNLRVLHLENNQISVIERGAFQDLKQLERLRLNRNRLQVLPELLFQSTPKLGRLNKSTVAWKDDSESKEAPGRADMTPLWQVQVWGDGPGHVGLWASG